jgi:UDP-N-acetylglucosamine diphosphorylase/glucosamine-1-phosphate N-acetyltransferase
MKSPLAKVLHPLLDRPLLAYVLDTVRALHPNRVLLVVGHQSDRVRERFPEKDLGYVLQQEQLGTGHAVQQTEEALADFEGDVLILCGDMPFIKTASLQALLKKHRQTAAVCSMLTLKNSAIKDFGRIVRDQSGKVHRIVEARDATEAEKLIDELNTGVYCFNKNLLFKALSILDNNKNVQSEHYLTDTIEYLVTQGHSVETVQTTDAMEFLGVNTPQDLEKGERYLKEKKDQS